MGFHKTFENSPDGKGFFLPPLLVQRNWDTWK